MDQVENDGERAAVARSETAAFYFTSNIRDTDNFSEWGMPIPIACFATPPGSYLVPSELVLIAQDARDNCPLSRADTERSSNRYPDFR